MGAKFQIRPLAWQVRRRDNGAMIDLLLIDADSMPVRHRSIILRRSLKDGIETLFVADRTLKDVEEARSAHTASLREPLRPSLSKEELRKIRSWIHMLTVESADGAADDKIVELARPGALVISHDMPLLERVIAKGAMALDDRGNVWDEGNIRERLSARSTNMALREMGVFDERTRRFDMKDIEGFANSLDSILIKNAE